MLMAHKEEVQEFIEGKINGIIHRTEGAKGERAA